MVGGLVDRPIERCLFVRVLVGWLIGACVRACVRVVSFAR